MSTSQEWAAEEFARHRPRLLSIAYRLIGSMWDAEDIVEDALERWLRADRSAVEEPVAFLTTVVTRLALDHLKSARVRREEYIGPWLPEPVLTDRLGGLAGSGGRSADPLEAVEARDSLSIATMHMMERLSPPERAVFVLRNAFDLPYEEIAQIIDVSVANARQLFHRARTAVSRNEIRFDPDPKTHAELLMRLLTASAGGDREELERLLADDVVAYADGGGRVRAALRPLVGSANVLGFLIGVSRKYPIQGELLQVEVGGQPALAVSLPVGRQLLMIDVVDGRITGIYAVLNPDKLSYFERQLREGCPVDHVW